MKKRLSIRLRKFLCSVLASLSLLGIAQPIAYAAVPDLAPGMYVFYTINKAMNLNCIFARGEGCELGTDNPNGELNEIFIVEHVGTSGYITIRPLHQKNCYIAGGKQGEVVKLKYGIPGNEGMWRPLNRGNGQYTLVNRKTSMALDCSNGHIGPESCGNRYVNWPVNGYAEAQNVIPVRISTSTTKLTPDKRVSPSQTTGSLVPSANQSMAVNAGLKLGVGAKIILDNLSSPAETNETLTWIKRSNNTYSLHFSHAPNACIAPSDIFPDSEIVLKQYRADDPSCHWEIYQVGSGYSFRNRWNLLMLDNFCARSNLANPQISYSYNGGMPQVYYMKKSSTTSSSAASSATSSSAESQILQRLNAMMDGSYGNRVYKLNTRYTGPNYKEQCKGFAKTVFQNIFGYNIGSTNKTYNYLISTNSSKTALVGTLTSLSGKSDTTIRNLFNAARAGDFVQIRRSHLGPHSAIYLYSDHNSVTFYEANLDNNNGIVKRTYTWQQLRSSNAALSVYTAKDYRLH